MIRLKYETQEFLRSITKNLETPIKQTHRKTGQTLDSKLTPP